MLYLYFYVQTSIKQYLYTGANARPYIIEYNLIKYKVPVNCINKSFAPSFSSTTPSSRAPNSCFLSHHANTYNNCTIIHNTNTQSSGHQYAQMNQSMLYPHPYMMLPQPPPMMYPPPQGMMYPPPHYNGMMPQYPQYLSPSAMVPPYGFPPSGPASPAPGTSPPRQLWGFPPGQ